MNKKQKKEEIKEPSLQERIDMAKYLIYRLVEIKNDMKKFDLDDLYSDSYSIISYEKKSHITQTIGIIKNKLLTMLGEREIGNV